MEITKSIEADLQLLSRIQPKKNTKSDMSLCRKLKILVSNITVEPVLLCYVLPSIMASLAVQNLNLEKACRVNLGYSNETCDAIASRNSSGYNSTEEKSVQILTASAAAIKSVIQSTIPPMLLIFMGSWSDRHNRRKPGMLFPVFGEVVTSICYLLCTYFFYELNMYFNTVSEAVPTALTGGFFIMFLSTYSYIGTVSSEETRTVRIGAVHVTSNVSMTVGIALSGILYRKLGFYGIFSIAFTMYLIAFLYGLFILEECPNNKLIEEKKDSNEKKIGFLQDFFSIKHVIEILKVAFKDGVKNRKKRVKIIMILVMVLHGPMFGEMNVMYLFVRYKFQWNEVNYSMYSTFNFVIHMIGTLFSLFFFTKFLKWDDSVMGMISSTSKVLSCFVYAFAPTPTIFCIGVIVEMLNGTSFIAMRSIISKLVAPDELGKIYAIFGVSEALMPLVYGPLYSFTYRSTIEYLPGAFFLVGGALTTPAVCIFYWLYREHLKDVEEDARNKAQEEKLLKDSTLPKN